MEVSYTEEKQAGQEGLFLDKVLGFTGLAVLFTGLFGWAYGRIILHLFHADDGIITSQGVAVISIVLAVAVVSSMLISIFATAAAWRSHKTPIVAYIAYIILEGLMFGSIVALGIEPLAIGIAFGITAVSFLACFAIGYLSKGRVQGAKMALMIISVGLLINFLTFGVWYLLFPSTFYAMYPIVSIILFVVASLYIIIDSNSVKNRIKDGYALTTGLALTCAFTLYTDFMYLFWRVLRLIIMLFGRSKR